MVTKKQVPTAPSLAQKVAFELSKESMFEVPVQVTGPIADKMMSDGADAVKGFEWFLTLVDRDEIASSLKQKFGLK